MQKIRACIELWHRKSFFKVPNSLVTSLNYFPIFFPFTYIPPLYINQTSSKPLPNNHFILFDNTKIKKNYVTC